MKKAIQEQAESILTSSSDAVLLIPPSKLRSLVALMAMLFLIMAGLDLWTQQRIDGLLLAIIGALLSLVAICFLIPGLYYLKLTPDSFVIKTIFNERTIHWKEVAEFKVSHAYKMSGVRIFFIPSRKSNNPITKLLTHLFGCDDFIHNIYSLNNNALVSLLREWQGKALERNLNKTNAWGGVGNV